jgi:predicted aspartyl protease
VSAKSNTDRPLSHAQFVSIIVVLAIAGVLALITLGRVAGPHGHCPSETQVWRPAASTCFAAYTNKTDPQLVGHQASTG